MALETEAGLGLAQAVALLGAGVIAAPVFIRLGLGSVLGYLAAGLIIGPFGLRVIADADAIGRVAELGVVMFLFLIGLEMRPAKLWALRRDIFRVGAAHVLACAGLSTAVAWVLFASALPGFTWQAALVAALGFALSSTAIIMKMMEDAGEVSTPEGGRATAILLFEDLSIVPLMALVAALAASLGAGVAVDARPLWQSLALAAGAIVAVFALGRWALNPLFALLARSGAREVMTAAALLVVLGAALVMEAGGLSMGMGAFLAGVLLSESSFRHQLEADVEPFRGILLGLFFMSVGMGLDIPAAIESWRIIVIGVIVFMAAQGLGAYLVARVFGAGREEGAHRAALFAQGGEFAFVLYGAALAAGVMDARLNSIMSAIVVLSMALAPLVVMAQKRLTPAAKVSHDGVEAAADLNARLLVIGFGRFAQLACQPLLTRGVDVSVIETDVDMIRAAGRFGFKVYYGDGGRLDVLRASGAARAEAVLVCVDKPEAADKIVALVKAEFPRVKLFVRAYDRGHTLRLIKAGVDYQIRETMESALTFAGAVLREMGVNEIEIAETIEDVRDRDLARLDMQIAGDLEAGKALLRGNLATPAPAPLVVPRRQGEALNQEAAAAIAKTTK